MNGESAVRGNHARGADDGDKDERNDRTIVEDLEGENRGEYGSSKKSARKRERERERERERREREREREKRECIKEKARVTRTSSKLLRCTMSAVYIQGDYSSQRTVCVFVQKPKHMFHKVVQFK